MADFQICYYLKRNCLRSLLAVATLGIRPVFNLWSSNCEEIICVVISVSAAVPAPQQLEKNNGLGLYI